MYTSMGRWVHAIFVNIGFPFMSPRRQCRGKLCNAYYRYHNRQSATCFPLTATLAMLAIPVQWKAPKSFKLTCHYQNVINASDQIVKRELCYVEKINYKIAGQLKIFFKKVYELMKYKLCVYSEIMPSSTLKRYTL